jgi:predicted transcriptional regulator YheO
MLKKRCFVISPIGERGSPTRIRSDKVLNQIIRPAVKECGYKVFRADEIDQPGLITSQVVRHIIEDALIVADLTERNANVFYELGICHSLGKPLVQLIARGEAIPFDIAGMRTISVDHQRPASREEAKQAIVRQVLALEKGRVKLETPISVVRHPQRRRSQTIRNGSLSRTRRKTAPKSDTNENKIEGKRLFQHRGYYPIDIAPKTNIPSLNHKIFVKSIKHFLNDENYDRLAVMDLVYLREDNLEDKFDVLKDEDLPLYEKLVKRYDLMEFISKFEEEDAEIFRNFVRIVNDIGDTLKDVHLEILLHNVRNPIRSIIACRNSESISGRKLFDPSTRFVVQYVKNQGRRLIRAMHSGSKLSYLKQFHRTKQVKATTTPLYSDKYGLIGILCVNIDIDSVLRLDKKGCERFFENYLKNSGYTPRFEKESM